MDVRTRDSIWTQSAPLELARGPLAEDVACDVLVIGTGITGALMAQRLSASGLDVIMVDQRTLARGSTIASTALIQYEIDVPLVRLARQIGSSTARSVYRQTRDALDDLRALVEDNGFDCELRRRPTLFLAVDEDDVALLHAETLARRAIGIEVSYLDAEALASSYAIGRAGAIRSEVSYELNPLKLTIALLKSAVRHGARIFDRTGMLVRGGIVPTPTVPLPTDTGHCITCKHVVYATGYDTPDQFPMLRNLCELRTTFALITEPVDVARLWPERALLWEHADPYFYARTTADDRIIVGGDDEPLLASTERDALLDSKRESLLAQLDRLVPSIRPVPLSRIWGATFAQTADGLPFIGSPDEARGCHFALGYGGNGITFSLIAARLIGDAIIDGKDHLADGPFAFSRPSVRPQAD